MNNEEVFEFLENNPVQYCATVGLDGKPKVRPFQMMYHENGDMYYCTGAKKDVYAELQSNPYLEISVSTLEKWLRIRGKVHWITSNETKEKCLNASPLVKSIYKSADNPNLKVFYIEDAEAVLADFSGNPPKTYNLNKNASHSNEKR
ncbi:MAG: pyridoxamine 5'-phosphate oxidase family protein [Clostridia bacterium]|nr:pyridoxamine 5'-phosphate oxidase family protein [Clostridia bacterium]